MKHYDFKVGDKVVTVYGETGVIIDFCKCEHCEMRRFFEPIWQRDDDGFTDYITLYDAMNGFRGYHKIGDYRFEDFDKEAILNRISYHEECIQKLENRLRVIENLQEEEKNA